MPGLCLFYYECILYIYYILFFHILGYLPVDIFDILLFNNINDFVIVYNYREVIVMLEFQGCGVSDGIAIGKIVYYTNVRENIKECKVDDPQAEIERYRNALELAKIQLQKLYDEACLNISKAESAIFQTHIMILEDSKFVDTVEELITVNRFNAEYAVSCTSKSIADIFKSFDDEYLKSRYSDIIDAGNTLIKILQNKKQKKTYESDVPVIIAAKELMPSETVSMKKSKLLGFITNKGSTNSHTAIIARTMGLPSVTQVDAVLSKFDGKTAIIDGKLGKIYIDPDKTTMAMYNFKKERYVKYRNNLNKQIGLPSVSKNGQKIKLSANIGMLDDIDAAITNDADAIGLFRSEYLFVNRLSYPSENEQFEAYKRVIKSFKKSEVVIRIADLSADEDINYLDIPFEKNPFMGFRGIRICLENEEFFKTQLRALYRASVFGRLKIMLTMINNVEEIEYVKRVIEKIKMELRAEGVQYNDNVRLGVMIETPAAAIISDEICKIVDFVSIGTNDLTQFTLAIDRGNQKLKYSYRPYHKAILRLIKIISDNAHKCGIPVSVCGDLASDISLTPFFLALKIDELSMVPSQILQVRSAVRETDTSIVPKILENL